MPDAPAQPAPYSAPSAPAAVQPAAFSAPSAPAAVQPSAFSAPSAPAAVQPAAFSAPSAPAAVQPAAYSPLDVQATASLVVDPAGANNGLRMTAAASGLAGNLISFEAVQTGTPQTGFVTITRTGNDILATMWSKTHMTLAGSLAVGGIGAAGVYRANVGLTEWSYLPMGGLFRVTIVAGKWSIQQNVGLGEWTTLAEQSTGVASAYATPDLVPAWTTVSPATGSVTGTLTPGAAAAIDILSRWAPAASLASIAHVAGSTGWGIMPVIAKTFFSGGTGIAPPGHPAPYSPP